MKEERKDTCGKCGDADWCPLADDPDHECWYAIIRRIKQKETKEKSEE